MLQRSHKQPFLAVSEIIRDGEVQEDIPLKEGQVRYLFAQWAVTESSCIFLPLGSSAFGPTLDLKTIPGS